MGSKSLFVQIIEMKVRPKAVIVVRSEKPASDTTVIAFLDGHLFRDIRAVLIIQGEVERECCSGFQFPFFGKLENQMA